MEKYNINFKSTKLGEMKANIYWKTGKEQWNCDYKGVEFMSQHHKTRSSQRS